MMNDRVISLQAAIDALCSICGNDCDKSEFVYDAPQDEQVILCPEHYALTQLPSAQPERKNDDLILAKGSKGEWILVKGSNGKDYHKMFRVFAHAGDHRCKKLLCCVWCGNGR